MRLWLILCGRPNSQKLNFEGRTISQITQGLVDGSLRWGDLLCGHSWWITYQRECMHFINGTWTQLQMDGSCSLLGFKIIITFEGQMTYGLSVLVFISYTIKTPLISLLLVHGFCKCLLSFLYRSSSIHCAPSHPLFCFVSCRMEIQHCRRKQYYNVGFMDLHVINEYSVMKWPNRTMKNIFSFLDKQHHMPFILLPYNFQ